MAVTWTYDGSHTITATFASTVGHSYIFWARDPDSGGESVTATLTSTTMTMTDFDTSNAVATYEAFVLDTTSGLFLDSTLFSYGYTGQAAGEPSAVWSWNGTTTVSVTFTTVPGLQYRLLARPAVSAGGSTTFTAVGGTETVTVTGLSLTAGEGIVFWLQRNGADVPQISTKYGVEGSTTLAGSTGSAPLEGIPPLDIGDTGSAGGVRIGVAFTDSTLTSFPTWTYLTDTDSLVASYEINRGRQFEFDKTDTGTAKVSINDRYGVLDPTNAAGPYYGLLQPLLQIQIELRNAVTGDWSTRFRGFIEDYDYVVEPFVHQDTGGNTVGVTRLEISCVDIFEILTAIEMQPGAFGDTPPAGSEGNIFFDNAPAATGVGNRIDQVMGDAGISVDFYVAFTLNVWMQETVYSPSENVLQVVQDVSDAEFPTVSNVYADRLGRLAIHGRQAKFDPDGVAAGATAGAWYFTRWKAGDEHAVVLSPTDTAHIRTFAYNNGLSKVFNSALCTPNGIDDTNKTTATGTDIAGQYFADSGSISQYGFRSWSAENLLLGAPTGDPLTTAGAGTLTGNNALDETLAYATYIVENYKDPRVRITDISFASMNPSHAGAEANWDLLCQVDISDVVEVYVRGPGDSPTAYIFNGDEFFVEGIRETCEPLNGDYPIVRTTLDLSPKAYFPLGGGGGVGL